MSSKASSITVDFSVNKRGQAQGKFKPHTKPKPKDKWVISEFTSPAGKCYIKRVNQSTGVVEVQRVSYH